MPVCTHAHTHSHKIAQKSGGERPRAFPVVERLRVVLQVSNRCFTVQLCVSRGGNVMGSAIKGVRTAALPQWNPTHECSNTVIPGGCNRL